MSASVHPDPDACGECPLVPVPPGMSRRSFLAWSAVAASALAAACGTGGAGDITSPFTGTFSLRVADYASLATVGGVALVTANGSPVAVVRTGTTTFLALSRICPHEGATIGTSGSGFMCPRHGATFNATGTWTGGQRTSSMRSYATTFDSASGTLTIG